MDQLFCSECDALLREITTTGELRFKCEVCGKNQAAHPEQTRLSYEDYVTQESGALHIREARNIAYDLTVSRGEGPCPNCGAKYVSKRLIGESKKLICGCSCCGNVY